MVVLEHQALADKGAELIELRLDWLSRLPDLGRLLHERPTPVVVTCRRPSDKGHWRHSEDQRLVLLRSAIVSEVDYIDLEADVADQIPRYGKTKRIISHHDFDETPDDLEAIHKELCTHDPDIIKLVTMANQPGDMVRMLQFVEQANRQIPTIGFCMGEFGVASRILCGKYGAPFTYATFSSERELAPGQLSFDQMRNLYRYDQINAETKVYGMLGDPIAHSMAPLIHNCAFRHEGINAVYLPFRVPKDMLSQVLKDFDWLDISGYSVTAPHKQTVLAKASEVSAAVDRSGAANTLVCGAGVKWRADNTEINAALDCIYQSMQNPLTMEQALAGRQVLLLGAGEMARVIGLGLIGMGAKITIANRTHAKAVELADELGCLETNWENRATIEPDILVNCTSVGMHPNVDVTPYEPNWLQDRMLVLDTVYNPENTLLLKQAKQRGCGTASGLDMFVRQAAAQFEMFTGKSAPLEFMRKTLRRGISPIS